MVTASEIASYAFCPKAWRLGSALGLRPNNERQLARGEENHELTAVLEQATQLGCRVAFALLALGLLLVGLFLWAVGR
ncbi:MAG: hypothetical protein U0790_03625 [Isosphaeraceae bacterium]